MLKVSKLDRNGGETTVMPLEDVIEQGGVGYLRGYDGKLEGMEEKAANTASALARLIEHLYAAGQLSEKDILRIAFASYGIFPWDEDIHSIQREVFEGKG